MAEDSTTSAIGVCQHDDMNESEYALSMLRRINHMREGTKQCDFVIKVEGKMIHVHRNIMMAGSDYFDAMLTHDTLERASGIVEMKETSFLIMKKLVYYLYTGQISICVKECLPLLYSARMLLLKAVCDKIVRFLKSRISLNSFFETRRTAKMFSLTDLSEACDNYALKWLDRLVFDEEFNQLEVDFVLFLVLSKRSISRRSEDSKLAIIVQWINADLVNRRQQLVHLMSGLDLSMVSSEYGRYLANNERVFYESGEGMKRLYLAATARYGKPSSEAPAVISFSESNALLIFNKRSRFLEAYRPGYNSWSKWSRLHDKMLDQHQYYTSAVCDEHVYVLMGDKSVYRLLLGGVNCDWAEMESMKNDHGDFMRATTHTESIFIVGNNSMERFDTGSNTWNMVETHGISCHKCMLVECKNCIYALGGHNGAPLSDVNRYSTITTTWSSVQSMNEARDAPSAAVLHNGTIFVAGGTGDRDTDVEFFDVATNVWTKIPSMNNTRNSFGLFYISGKFFAVGNGEYWEALAIEAFEDNDEKWGISRCTSEKEVMSLATIATYLSW